MNTYWNADQPRACLGRPGEHIERAIGGFAPFYRWRQNGRVVPHLRRSSRIHSRLAVAFAKRVVLEQ